jgi:glucose uptake protein GlcU
MQFIVFLIAVLCLRMFFCEIVSVKTFWSWGKRLTLKAIKFIGCDKAELCLSEVKLTLNRKHRKIAYWKSVL